MLNSCAGLFIHIELDGVFLLEEGRKGREGLTHGIKN